MTAAPHKASLIQRIMLFPPLPYRGTRASWPRMAVTLDTFMNKAAAIGPPRAYSLRTCSRHENLALSGCVGCGNDPFLLHALDQARSLVVADLKPTLDIARRHLLVAQNDLDRLIIELVARATLEAAFGPTLAAASLVLGLLGDTVNIFGRALGLEMADDLLDLILGDEGRMEAGNAPAAGHIEHVALTEQLLGTLLAENGAAVDLGGDLEADAGGKVRLDGAGDDVDRRALGCHDDMDAGGARHLGKALDGAFDVLAGDHHQVG